MSFQLAKAADFICLHARLLERLLFDVRFRKADPAAVGKLVQSYLNRDGGLGHALEPDVRCSESQPLFAEIGLMALRDAGVRDAALALSICDFMERVATDSGLVPILLPSAFQAPRASHWQSAGEPGLNPTAAICGLLHWQRVEHPWLSIATETCCGLIETEPNPDAHVLRCATRFVENLPAGPEADVLADAIAAKLPKAAMYIAEAPGEGYGLSPLEFAPTPASRWRSIFTDTQIEGHLDHLEALQMDDGGWPISWEAPGPAATSEWRAHVTLNAVNALVAYGRVPEPAELLPLA